MDDSVGCNDIGCRNVGGFNNNVTVGDCEGGIVTVEHLNS